MKTQFYDVKKHRIFYIKVHLFLYEYIKNVMEIKELTQMNHKKVISKVSTIGTKTRAVPNFILADKRYTVHCAWLHAIISLSSGNSANLSRPNKFQPRRGECFSTVLWFYILLLRTTCKGVASHLPDNLQALLFHLLSRNHTRIQNMISFAFTCFPAKNASL